MRSSWVQTLSLTHRALETKHLNKVYAAMQEQVKAARQGAAGTMDDYTFVGEDGLQEGPSGAAVQQSLSAEQQYKTEMLQELQVNVLPHVGCGTMFSLAQTFL